MYVIYYKREEASNPLLIGVCFTKWGSERACKHFHKALQAESENAKTEIYYEEALYYPALKIGYISLKRARAREYRRLKKMEYKENLAINNRRTQQIRLSDLYN